MREEHCQFLLPSRTCTLIDPHLRSPCSSVPLLSERSFEVRRAPWTVRLPLCLLRGRGEDAAVAAEVFLSRGRCHCSASDEQRLMLLPGMRAFPLSCLNSSQVGSNGIAGSFRPTQDEDAPRMQFPPALAVPKPYEFAAARVPRLEAQQRVSRRGC